MYPAYELPARGARRVSENEPVTATELRRADLGLRTGQIALLHTGWTDQMYGTFPDYFTRSPYLNLVPSGSRWLVVARAPRAQAR